MNGFKKLSDEMLLNAVKESTEINIEITEDDLEKLSNEELKNVVIDICKTKEVIIADTLVLKNLNPIPYMTTEDYDDLANWDREDYIKYLENILYAIRDSSNQNDSKYCPWCSKYLDMITDDCMGCTYGKRHGFCLEDDNCDSTYVLIRKAIKCYIYKLPNLLVDIYNIITIAVMKQHSSKEEDKV